MVGDLTDIEDITGYYDNNNDDSFFTRGLLA